MPKPIHGIDVSHHQNPSEFIWRHRPADLSFVYVRGAYGKKPDVRCEEHVRGALKAGLDVGLYFFVRDAESVDAQWEAITAAVDEYAYSEAPVVAIDAEWQVDAKGNSRTPDPAKYVPLVDELLRRAEDTYGGVLLYTNLNSFFPAMGSPPQWLKKDLWVADYRTSLIRPPGSRYNAQPVIWQHTVDVIPGDFYRGKKLDQNSLHKPLPRMT